MTSWSRRLAGDLEPTSFGEGGRWETFSVVLSFC